MQEFRRPDWCAHLIATQKTLTGMSEHDLLLLATVLTTQELEGFQVLSKAHDQWKTFQTETSLHKPLKLDRGIKCPDPTKFGSGGVSSVISPSPPKAQAMTELKSASFIGSAPKNPVSGRTEVWIQSNESLQWKAKVIKFKWPILTFDCEIRVAFDFLNACAIVQGQKYNLVLGRTARVQLAPQQVIVLPSPESILFKKHLDSMKKKPAAKAGLGKP